MMKKKTNSTLFNKLSFLALLLSCQKSSCIEANTNNNIITSSSTSDASDVTVIFDKDGETEKDEQNVSVLLRGGKHGVESGNINTREKIDKTKDVVVPVVLWDEDGSPVTSALPPNYTQKRQSSHDDYKEQTKEGTSLSFSSHLPRFVVGLIGSVSPESPEKKGLLQLQPHQQQQQQQQRPTIVRYAQHTTFDLGNKGESMLLAQECRACSSPSKSHFYHVDGCPPTLPTKCHHHDNSSFVPCWSSHPYDYIPLVFTPNNNKSYNCSDFNAQNGGYYRADDDDGGGNNNNSISTRVCTQCFGARSHSRFFISQYSDNLVLLDVTAYNHDGSHTAFTKEEKEEKTRVVSHLGKSFQYGAIIGTVPSIDRLWSNIGLGATSKFLEQMNVSCILFSLNLSFDSATTTTTTTNNDVRKSEIILNPSSHRYKFAATPAKEGEEGIDKEKVVKNVPYYIQDGHRLHPNLGFRFGRDGNVITATTILPARDDDMGGQQNREKYAYNLENDPSVFHIDSGNNGISIQDAQFAIEIEKYTGGEWIIGCGYENEDEARAKLYSEIMWEEEEEEEKITSLDQKEESLDEQQHRVSCLAIPAIEDEDDESKYSKYPDLFVILGHDVEVRIPSRGWILGEVHERRDEDEIDRPNHKQKRMWTIFNTYHKNVLGLPLLTAPGVDFVFDDVDEALYVVNRRDGDMDSDEATSPQQ